jgi:UDP-glucose 4-epimerase
MRTSLVTGGAGFIGSHLAEALLNGGDEVYIVDDLSVGKAANLPPGAHFVHGDVADRELMAEMVVKADVCFHLAAVASVERSCKELYHCHRINQGSFVGLLEGLARARKPIALVYASSAAVYGMQSSPVTEDSRCAPSSPYGIDKLACEMHARVAANVWGIPTCGLRFFNVYGPRQDASSPYSGVVAKFKDAICLSTPLTIFGEGDQIRDFVYVSDAVQALMLAAEHANVHAPVVNVCTGRGTTVLELAHAITTHSARAPRLMFAPARPGDVEFSIGDPCRAGELLGWRAGVSLLDGLRLTLDRELEHTGTDLLSRATPSRGHEVPDVARNRFAHLGHRPKLHYL